MHSSRALKEKRPLYEQRHDKVILQHDNTRPYVAQLVKTYLENKKWLNGKSYLILRIRQTLRLPIIACSDRWHMVWAWAEQHFHSYEDAEKCWVDSLIASKDVSFHRRGIQMLPERWEGIEASNALLSVTCFLRFFLNN